VTETLLSVEDITLRFGGVTALDSVSFEVHRREFFAIIGPNGAGKTSLFNCLSGMARPTGSITLSNSQLVGQRPDQIARLGVGRTFQNLGLFLTMSVLENVLVSSHIRPPAPTVAGWWGRSKRVEFAAREHAYQILDLVGLADFAHAPVSSLPYGTRKRVELAKAAASNPRLLLLDEPVAGMNTEETEELIAHVYRLKYQLDLTLVLIEHDIHLIMDVADRVLALDFGNVIGLGTPEEIQTNPRVIEAYLGIEHGAAAEPALPTKRRA
jgi:branched-chain amino acid transport system ATP-binding protein